MLSFIFRRAALVTVAACGVLIASCGGGGGANEVPDTGATLEGTVTYGTDKVLVAMVVAQGESWSATGFVGEDGRYKIENAPLGQVQIGVNTEAGKGQLMSKIMAQAQGKLKGRPPKVVEVPAKYADPRKSGITTTVQEGTNTFDIKIPR
ncbi:MAG TPA: hypothetical protein VIL46_04350 [Gemmataceae bacterium]